MAIARIETRAVRVREDVRDLIDAAARMPGKSRSEFMIDAARQAADTALPDACQA